MAETIREYGRNVKFPKPGTTGIMSLPRDINIVDNLNINAEHMVRRTTVGGAFEIMFRMFRRWVDALSRAILCWMLTILFFMHNVNILAFITAILGAYYFGTYKIWNARWKGRLGFAALVPVL